MNRYKFDFNELENPVVLTVKTKSPDKWILFDRETGEMYKGNENGYWDRLEPVLKNTSEINND
jgi:hypothetical protein